MLVRRASESDLGGIAAIYDPEVREGIATFMTVPYSAEEWRTWLRGHEAPRYPAIVGVEPGPAGDHIVGWASLAPWSPRAAYARTAESSVYVATGSQGRGVGRRLMEELLAMGRAAGVCVVIARVVEQNRGSVRFHESIGFETVGIMRRVGEKFGRLLDVRVMELHLDGG